MAGSGRKIAPEQRSVNPSTLFGWLVVLLTLVPLPATAQQPEELPSFLPTYYAPLFDALVLARKGEKDGLVRYAYSAASRPNLSIEGFACDRPRCQTVFNNALQYFNADASRSGGRFLAASDTELQVAWSGGLGESTAMVFKLPKSLQFWVYKAKIGEPLDAEAYRATLEPLVDRQRYEEALHEGNVEMGHWAAAIHRHGRRLFIAGQRDAGAAVLRNLLTTSPFHFEAHLDLAEQGDDKALAQASASVVYDNAETGELTARAAKLLNRREPAITDLPLLKPGETGLQVILIPLPPADVRVLDAAARIYEQITQVPVRLARLQETWTFGVPGRLPEQRNIQRAIIQHRGPNVDFTGWSRQRYEQELWAIVEGKDALAKFGTQAFIGKLDERPLQFDAQFYLPRLLELLKSYRGGDSRVMYVGATAANIYAGDANYLFSLHAAVGGQGASLLSYAMMMAKGSGDPYESRRRLTERLAKELVPASLKNLGIARPADPSDPYSYSDGVTRLDQKSLTLSAQTRAALDALR
jgi:hypothetical protein